MTSSKRISIAGSTYIEILLAIVIFSILLSAFVGSVASLGFVQVKTKLKTEAVQISREYMEIAYNMSLQDWSEFAAINGSFIIKNREIPDINSPFPYYQLVPPSQLSSTENFSSVVTFSPAIRDASGNVIDDASRGTEDQTTRKITVTTKAVAEGIIEPVIFETYLISFSETL